MKKIIAISILMICISAFANAQDLTSKKGVPILPEKGDFALGIDAVPFFDYFGNFFNGNLGNSAPGFDYAYPFTIYGKYFIDAKTAYRGKVQLGYTSITDIEFAYENPNANNPFDVENTVEDEAKQNTMDIVLGAGIEKRRGKGRVQGIYGAEAELMFGSNKTEYNYGNEWDEDDYAHFITNFGNNLLYDNAGNIWGWVTEDKIGSTFGFGVRAFVGVEYFFAPKISIGGELGWGIRYVSMGEGEMTYEYIDTSVNPNTIESITEKTGGGSAFGFGTDNVNGAINLLFYF